MEHRLGVHGGDALGQRSSAHQMHGMVGVVTVVHLGAHDLAAVQLIGHGQQYSTLLRAQGIAGGTLPTPTSPGESGLKPLR